MAVTPEEDELAARLRRHVSVLAGEIGPRSTARAKALARAAEYIETELRAVGHVARMQPFRAGADEVHNIEAELRGTAASPRVVIVGAHYDTVTNSPGANDNGSGVAAMLELAREFAGSLRAATVRFVAFTNEEPPHFMSDTMGSLVYARRCRERHERVVAMYSLETIGYYSEEPGSQAYPPPLHLLFPSTGNFIAMVSNFASTLLLRRTVTAFRTGSTLKVIGSPAPEALPGVSWSDHWSFWQQGYPAIMLTDTAPFRYPHYHSVDDTPDKLDYERMSHLVAGMSRVVSTVAG